MLRAMCLIALCAGVCNAQRMLTPDDFALGMGDAVGLSIRSLSGQADTWPTNDVAHFCVLLGGYRQNRQTFPAPGAGEPSWTMQHPGVAVIGLNLKARAITMPLARLQAIAPGAALPGADDSVPVERIESFQALVRVNDPAGPNGAPTEKIGLQVEIRPQFDPTFITPGHDLGVRAYVRGDGVTGAHIHARNLDTGDTASCITDREGLGHFRVTSPGRWVVWFYDLRRIDGRWTLFSSTLTFQSPPGEAP